MDSNSSTGGGRRNRGRGKRNANRRHNNSNSGSTGGAGPGSSNKGGKGNISGSASGSKKIPVPPPPQVKLALRHIGNPITFGTTKAVLEGLVLPLVEACNAKALAGVPSSSSSGTITASTSVTTNTSFCLEFDQAAKKHLIEEEEAAQRYSKEWKQQQQVEKDNAGNPDEEAAKGQAIQSQDQEKNDASETLEVIPAPPSKPPPNVPVITCRPLYVVPPKKTRRRGDRPGVAYILLTAPKIEKIEIPATVPEHGIPKSVPHTQTKESLVVVSEDGTTQSVLADTTIQTMGTSDSTDPPTPVVEPSATVPPPISSTAPSSTASIKKSTDYSRHVAQGRLLLQNAVDMLINLTSVPTRPDGSKGTQPPSTDGTGLAIQVETAMSGKTWRWQYARPDRREGTIESTADYKNWMASLEKQQAELKSRPKPTPGGGYVASSEDGAPGAANAAGIGSSAGQPIAALVQHLRAKQQDLKRKKAKKKKETPAASTGTTAKDTKKQGGKGGKNTKKAKPSNKTDGASVDPDKKKPKKPAKKKGIGGGKTNPKAVAPTTLLKANSGP